MSSLKQKLMKDIEALVDLYIEQVTGEKPSSDKKDKKQKEAPKEIDLEDLSLSRISSCNLAELKALCKTRGLKVSGKKDELIERLRETVKGKNESDEEEDEEKVEKKKAKPEKKQSKSKKENLMPEVLKKLASKTTACSVRKNAHGNLEHPQTGMIFENGVVVGVQEDDGNVRALTDEDIQTCKQQKFPFQVPKNLETDDLDKEEEDEDDEEKEEKVEKKSLKKSPKKEVKSPKDVKKDKSPKKDLKKDSKKDSKKDKIDALLEGDLETEEIDPEEVVSEEELEDDLLEDD